MTDVDPASVRHALLTCRRLDRTSELWLAALISDFLASRDPEPRLPRAILRERNNLLRYFASRFHPGLKPYAAAQAILADLARHQRASAPPDDARTQLLDALSDFDVPKLRRLRDIL